MIIRCARPVRGIPALNGPPGGEVHPPGRSRSGFFPAKRGKGNHESGAPAAVFPVDLAADGRVPAHITFFRGIKSSVRVDREMIVDTALRFRGKNDLHDFAAENGNIVIPVSGDFRARPRFEFIEYGKIEIFRISAHFDFRIQSGDLPARRDKSSCGQLLPHRQTKLLRKTGACQKKPCESRCQSAHFPSHEFYN